MKSDLRHKAERFVANYYDIRVKTARALFNDEIEAYMHILEIGLDEVLELMEKQK